MLRLAAQCLACGVGALVASSCSESALPPGSPDARGSRDLAGHLGAGDGGFTDQDAADSDGGPAWFDAGPRGDWGTADACRGGALGPGFSFAAPLVIQAENPGQIVAYDFNRDARIDLAFIGGPQTDTLEVVFGKGNGGFSAPVSYPVLPRGTDGVPPLYVVDLDNDGVADLVTVSPDFVVSALFGRPAGAFTPARQVLGSRQPGPIAPGAVALTFGDVNGDHLLDLFLTGGRPGVFLGIGGGDLKYDPGVPLPPGTGIDGAVFADLNGDGKVDLAYGNDLSNYMEVLLGHGNGSFNKLPFNLDYWGAEFVAFAADVNRDGNQDLLFGFHGPGVVRFGRGDGTFGMPYTMCGTRFDVGAPGGGVDDGGDLQLADLDGDGNLDTVGFVVHGGAASLRLAVCRGSANGWFRAPDLFQVAPFAGEGIATFAIGDFNNDCRPDVAMAAGNIGIFLNTTP